MQTQISQGHLLSLSPSVKGCSLLLRSSAGAPLLSLALPATPAAVQLLALPTLEKTSQQKLQKDENNNKKHSNKDDKKNSNKNENKQSNKDDNKKVEKEDKKNAKRLVERLVLAVALPGAKVQLYSAASGDLIRTLSLGLADATDLLFDPVAAVLYIALADGHLEAWDMSSAARLWNLHAHDKAVSRLALQGDTLISADYHLKQWKLNGTSLPVLVQQFTGHAARITQLAVTPDGKHCLSTAEEDRYTCIWPLSSPSQASMTGNVGALVLDQVPTFLCISPSNAVFALGESGQGFIFADLAQALSTTTTSSSAKGKGKSKSAAEKTKTTTPPLAASCTITIDSHIPVLCASFPDASEPCSLDLVWGRPGRPTLERILYTDANGDIPADIKLDRHLASLLGTGSGSGGNADNGQQTYKDVQAPFLKPSQRTSAPLRLPSPTRALSTTTPTMTTTTAAHLSQCLASRDDALLDTILGSTAVRAIGGTVGRLSPAQGAVLLEALLERMQRAPGRVGRVLPWVRACVRVHGAAAGPAWTGVYETLKRRADSYTAVLGLMGRLELVSGGGVIEGDAADAGAGPVPVAVYDEEEDDDDDEDEGIDVVSSEAESIESMDEDEDKEDNDEDEDDESEQSE